MKTQSEGSDGLFRFSCPHCKKRLKARPADQGRQATCRDCGNGLTVPRPLHVAPPHVAPPHVAPPHAAPPRVVPPHLMRPVGFEPPLLQPPPLPHEERPVLRPARLGLSYPVLIAAGSLMLLSLAGTAAMFLTLRPARRPDATAAATTREGGANKEPVQTVTYRPPAPDTGKKERGGKEKEEKEKKEPKEAKRPAPPTEGPVTKKEEPQKPPTPPAPAAPSDPVAELAVLSGHKKPVRHVQATAPARVLSADSSGQLIWWEMPSGRKADSFTAGASQVQHLGLSRDGRRAVVFHLQGDSPGFGPRLWKGVARVWDLKDKKALGQVSGTSLSAAVLTPDGTRVVTTDNSGVRANPDGGFSFGGRTASAVWEADTGKAVREMPAHLGSRLAISPDGRLLAGAQDSNVTIWKTETGERVAGFRAGDGIVLGMAFAPNGKRLLAGGAGGDLRLFEMDGREAARFTGHTGRLFAVAVSPDGTRVLSGACPPVGKEKTEAADHSVRVWDATTGKELHRYAGHEGGTTAVAFTADGRRGLSGGVDGKVRVWGLPGAKAREGGSSGSEPAPPLVADPSLRPLQGKWKLAELRWPRQNSTSMLLVTEGDELTIEGDRMTIRSIGKGNTRQVHTYRIAVDNGKSPKVLTMTPLEGENKGKPFRSIYDVSGNTLRRCVHKDGLASDFEIRQGQDVDAKHLFVYSRVGGSSGPDVEKRFRFKDGLTVRNGKGVINVDGEGNMNVKWTEPNLGLGPLTFPEPGEVTYRRRGDQTLLANREGVTAKDDAGKTWTSRRVTLGGKEVFAFFVDE